MKDPCEFLKHYRNKLRKIKNWKKPVSEKLIDNLLNGALKLQKVASNSDAVTKKESLSLFFNWMKIILDIKNKININDESKNGLFENMVLSISKKMLTILYENCWIPFWHYHLIDMWNILLNSCSSERLKKLILLKPRMIYNLLCLVHFIGHYGTQKLLLQILMKMLNTLDYNTKYNLMKMTIQSEEFVKNLLSFKLEDFDNEARKILNDFNLNICEDCTVYSIEVESIAFGEYVINTENEWINFNSTPKSLSFSCNALTFGITSNKWISFELLLSEVFIKGNKLTVKSNYEPILIPYYEEFPITILDIRQIDFILSNKVADDLKSKKDLFTYINGSSVDHVINDEYKNDSNSVSGCDLNSIYSSKKQSSEVIVPTSDFTNGSVTKCDKLPDLFENCKNEKICSKILLPFSDKQISINNTFDSSNLCKNLMTENNLIENVYQLKRKHESSVQKSEKRSNLCKTLMTENNQIEKGGNQLKKKEESFLPKSEKSILNRLGDSQPIQKDINNKTIETKSKTQPIPMDSHNKPISCKDYLDLPNQINKKSDDITIAMKTTNVSKRQLYSEKLTFDKIEPENKTKNSQKVRLINLVKPLIKLDTNNDDTGTIVNTATERSKICDENALNEVLKEISENGGYLKIKELLKNPLALSQFTHAQIKMIENNLNQINRMTENSANKLNLDIIDNSKKNSSDIYDIRNVSPTRADEINNLKKNCSNKKRKASEQQIDKKDINRNIPAFKRICKFNDKVSFSYRVQNYLESMEAKRKESVQIETISDTKTRTKTKAKTTKAPAENLKKSGNPVKGRKRQTQKESSKPKAVSRRKSIRIDENLKKKKLVDLNNNRNRLMGVSTRSQRLKLDDKQLENGQTKRTANKNCSTIIIDSPERNPDGCVNHSNNKDNIFDNLKLQSNLKGSMPSNQYECISISTDSNNNYELMISDHSDSEDIDNLSMSDITIREAIPMSLSPIILSNTILPKTKTPELLFAKYLENSKRTKQNNEQLERNENNVLDSIPENHFVSNDEVDILPEPIQIVAAYQSEKSNIPVDESSINSNGQLELTREEVNAIDDNCNDNERDWIFERYFNSLSTENNDQKEVPSNSNCPNFLFESNVINFESVSQQIISHVKMNTTYINENQIQIHNRSRQSYLSNIQPTNLIQSADIISSKRKSSCINDYQIVRKSQRIESTAKQTNILMNTFMKACRAQVEEATNDFSKICEEKNEHNKILQLAKSQLERLEQSQSEIQANLQNFAHLQVLIQKVGKDLKDSIQNMKRVQKEGEAVIKSLYESIQRERVVENEYSKTVVSIENLLRSVRTDLWKKYVNTFINKIVNKFTHFYDLD